MPDDRPHAATVEAHLDGATASAVHHTHGWEIQLSADRGRLDVAVAVALLAELTDRIASDAGGAARWRVPVATPEHRRIAATAGFTGRRRIVQMRRPLPLPWSTSLQTRSFRPGLDDTEWLALNRAAFGWHPEPGSWTEADLDERLTATWFDAAGFLLHPVEGPLDGFCWTKVHHELDPATGEIFVIGVHPDAAGRGLGRELVLAGLDHLTSLGLTEAMLYTEADNVAARSLYDRLGFEVHHEVTVFEKPVFEKPVFEKPVFEKPVSDSRGDTDE